MKIQSLLRYCLFLSILPFLGCSDSKQEDATPEIIPHEVIVKVEGWNVRSELYAYLQFRSVTHVGNAMRPGPGATIGYEGDVFAIHKLGTLTSKDFVEVTLSFDSTNEGVGSSYPSFVKIPSDTKFTAYIIVDDQVRKSVTLDATQSGPGVQRLPYLHGVVLLDLSTL